MTRDDWPSEDPTLPGQPPESEAETVIERGPGVPPPPPGPPPPEGPTPEDAERSLWPWLLALGVAVVVGIILAVLLTRGGGHKGVVVPNVLGMKQAAAVSEIQSAGFDSAVKNKFSAQPKGTVVDQSPASGTKADKGSKVTLTVSQGQEPVTVPNLLGLPQSEAVSQLTQAGLNSNVVLVPSTAKQGRVVAQNPTSGKQLPPGSAVRLNVSKGRQQTTTVTHTVTTTQTTTTTQPTTTVVTTTQTTTGTTTTTP